MLPHVLIWLDLHSAFFSEWYNVNVLDVHMYGHTPTGLNIYEFSQSAHILNNMGMALATQVINFLIKQLPLGKEISLFSESWLISHHCDKALHFISFNLFPLNHKRFHDLDISFLIDLYVHFALYHQNLPITPHHVKYMYSTRLRTAINLLSILTYNEGWLSCHSYHVGLNSLDWS